MDTAAIAIPIPVQPIEPPPAQGAEVPPDETPNDPSGFANALEQQLAQTALAGTGTARPALPPTAAVPDAPETKDEDASAAPDTLIAMIATPLYAQAPPSAIAAPRASGTTAPPAGGPGERRFPAERPDVPAQRAAAPRMQAFDPAARAEVQHAAQTIEREVVLAPVSQVMTVPDAAMDASLHAPAVPAVHVQAHAPATAEPQVAARVGSAEWGDGLARQVTLMVKNGEQTAQLRLDPPDLGPLEVRLSMARGDDSVAHAQFVSPHAAVRDALEAALPQLRTLLADNGITLGQASVGEGYARDEARDPQQSRSNAGEPRSEEAHSGGGMPRPLVRVGLVDTFA